MKSRATIPIFNGLPGRDAIPAGKTALRLISTFLLLMTGFYASAQQTNLNCDLTSVAIVPATYTGLSTASSSTGGGSWGTVFNNNLPANVVDAATNNYAQGNITLSGSVTLRVNSTSVYSGGNYAGFVVAMSGLNINALSGITLRTYLGATLQETVASATLLGVSLGGGQTEIGFYTDKPYDGIEVTYASTVTLGSSFDVYYAVMRGTGSCTVTATPPCNAPIHPLFSNYRMVVDPAHTGLSGITTSNWVDLDNLTDADTTNAATLGIGVSASVLSTATLGLKRTVGTFPAGYFAGFDIGNRALLGLGLLNNLTVTAYRNDTVVGSATGNGLLLGASLLGNSGRQTIGFITTDSFDEIEMTLVQPVGVNLGTTSVYGAVVRNFCAGPTPPCNIPVAQKEVSYPVYINTARTGFTGAACLLCSIDSIGNLLDNDTLNATTISLVAGALTTGSVSVRDAITTYPGGTYAGFEIANPTLANLGVLSNVEVEIWRAGVRKQGFSGNSLLVGLPSSLISGTPRYNIGFLTDSSFDEVRLNISQPVSVNLGTTYVYSALIERFCPGTLQCNATNWLTTPAHSVLIDQRQTGITGAVCALCTVNNPNNVITPSTTDFATLVTTGGILARTSLAVKDAVTTYPAGSLAGFAVQDPNNLLQLNLLRTISVITYNDGVQQDSVGAGQLLNLSLLVLQLNPSSGYYTLGLRATKPFDEVKISITPVAGVAPVLNVFGAYVDTRLVDTISSTQICARPPVAEPDHIATRKNAAVNGNLKTNDRDPANLVLSYNTTPATAPRNGSVTIGAGGTFTYTPTTSVVGLDSFAYQVCNSESLCTTAWAYVSVLEDRIANGPNTAHIVQPDRSETIMNIPVAGNAAANDIDVEQRPLNYAVTSNPLHGTLNMTTNGQYIYTPDSSYVGTDSAYVTVCDTASTQICRSAKLLLVVYPVSIVPNNPPYAADDVSATRRGLPTTGNVLTNDSDPDNDPITATPITTVPGTTGIFTMGSNGVWSFNPAAGYTGTVSVVYTISDGRGGRDTATLSIAVVPYTGPDFTPTIGLGGLNFITSGHIRDFRVDVSEILNGGNEGQLIIRIVKPSAFNVIFSDTMTVINVGGLVSVSNANWIFTENAAFVTCTLKPNVAIPPFSIQQLGFRLERKPGIPANTSQNLTVSIANTTGGDGNNGNNQYTVTVTAQ